MNLNKFQKRQFKDQLESRPSTVLLNKPDLLNPKLLGALDMSRLSREHLIIIADELVRFERADYKKTDKQQRDNDCFVELDNDDNAGKRRLANNKTYRIRTNDDYYSQLSTLPVTCVTCERSDLPSERFHSHPAKVYDEIGRKHIRKYKRKPLIDNSIGNVKKLCNVQRTNESDRKTNFIDKATKYDDKDTIAATAKENCGESRENSISDEKQLLDSSQYENTSLMRPRLLCELCGKTFGSSTIEVHKDQCLRKIHYHSSGVENESSLSDLSTIIECYICHKGFDSKLIAVHENKCLQSFRASVAVNLENRYKVQDVNNITAGIQENDSFWLLHQAQLVSCKKCGRTFHPDRLDVHFKCCKAPTKQMKK